MATTFYNKATLTYNGVTATSNTVTGELVEIVSATRTVLTDGYTRGTEKTFVISLVNTGSAPVTGLTVSDDLGEYTEGTLTLTPLTYVGGSAKIFAGGVEQTGVTVNAGPPLTFTGVGIPAGGSTEIVYKATANEFAPLGTGAEITAAATVTGAALAAPVEAAVTVSAEEGPILSIVKSVDPAVVTANGTLTYTFNIENTGIAAADGTDNVVFSDVFDPALASVTAALNGVPLTGTEYTYDSGTGEFATNPGVITVPAAAFTQDPTTGVWNVKAGVAVLTVTGTV